jgi:hypothetical protein
MRSFERAHVHGRAASGREGACPATTVICGNLRRNEKCRGEPKLSALMCGIGARRHSRPSDPTRNYSMQS